MKKLLVVTNNDERSADLLVGPDCETNVVWYSHDLLENDGKLSGYDFVYFRDPFTVEYNLELIDKIIVRIRELNPDAYFVDDIKNTKDILIEDKWRQYALFKDLMPRTKILKNINNIDYSKSFVKKRVSSRARGVIFDVEDFPDNVEPSDYIVQDKIEIIEEIRALVVRGEVLDKGVVKISKTDTDKVKVTDETVLTRDINHLALRIAKALPQLDLVGIDIARTNEDELLLIEINRSPQFNLYTKKTGINPFHRLVLLLT